MADRGRAAEGISEAPRHEEVPSGVLQLGTVLLGGVEDLPGGDPPAPVGLDVAALAEHGVVDPVAVPVGEQARGEREAVGLERQTPRLDGTGRQRPGQVVAAVERAGVLDEPAGRARQCAGVGVPPLGRQVLDDAVECAGQLVEPEQVRRPRSLHPRCQPEHLVGAGLGGLWGAVGVGLVDRVGVAVGRRHQVGPVLPVPVRRPQDGVGIGVPAPVADRHRAQDVAEVVHRQHQLVAHPGIGP